MQKRLKILLVVISVALVVIPVAMFEGFLITPPSPQNAEIEITANISGSPVYNAANTGFQNSEYFSNVSVSVFSIVPDSMFSGRGVNLSSANQTNNSYQVLLFAGKADSNGEVSGHLNSIFYHIVNEWRQILKGRNATVSLQIVSSLTIRNRGYLYVYDYWNNIPFNPFNASFSGAMISPAKLHSALFFNLSSPSEVINMSTSSTIQPDRQAGPGTCPTGTTYDTLYTNTPETIMPLMGGILDTSTYNASFGESSVDYSTTQISSSATFAFNSLTSQQTKGFIAQSTESSWQGSNASIQVIGGPGSGLRLFLPNDNMSLVYIPKTYVHIWEYREYYTYTDGSNCAIIDVGTFTDLSVSYVQNSEFSSMSSYFYQLKASPFWKNVMNNISKAELSSVTIPPQDNLNNWAYAQSDTSYSNAADTLHMLEGLTGTILAGIGLGLTIATALSVIPVVGTAAQAVNDVNAALAVAGLVLAEVSALSSISVTSLVSTYFNEVSIHNNPTSGQSGTDLTVNSYGAVEPTEFQDGSTTVSFNAPFPVFWSYPS